MADFAQLVSIILQLYHGRAEAEAARLVYRHVAVLMAGNGLADARDAAGAIMAAEAAEGGGRPDGRRRRREGVTPAKKNGKQ